MMTKQKIEKEMVYEELGFPVILRNVPMVAVRGVWAPDIDLNILHNVALLTLAHHPSDMTGNQVRFIRNYLRLTQAEFGKLFGVTHAAVTYWEKMGNKRAKMKWVTQRGVRLWLLDQLLSKDSDFRRIFRKLHRTAYSRPTETLEFDVPTDLVAV